METYIDLNDLKMSLDPSVRHITRTACMALSGAIQNGLYLTQNPSSDIIIYKDRIDFGRCLNPEFSRLSGYIFPNFYIEYGNIIYRYGDNIKHSFWSRTIDYTGVFPPSVPDNAQLFNLIYPRFA